MTQEQPQEQRNFVKESLEQLTQEDLNQCINALLQSDPLIATRFDNIRYQVVITKQGAELDKLRNSNGVVHDAEIIAESVS
tara:strand:+ start:2782 stop:3024 length:243 start_codon:yes stop_codon:yes gene_type:complete